MIINIKHILYARRLKRLRDCPFYRAQRETQGVVEQSEKERVKAALRFIKNDST